MYLAIYFEPTVKLAAFNAMLERCGPPLRRSAVLSLERRHMAALFEAAAESGPLGLDHFVPADTKPLQQVIHHGRNSLWAFSHFQKRFCRPDHDADELWGYNHNGWLASTATGPGYFVARANDRGGVVVDYGAQPPRRPDGWPAIIPNDARLGRFVWHGLTDVVRRINDHAVIGRGYRHGKPLDNWFVLVRDEPPA